MKTLHVPRDLSHVVMYGMIMCVLCQHACCKGILCPCCREKHPLYRGSAASPPLEAV